MNRLNSLLQSVPIACFMVVILASPGSIHAAQAQLGGAEDQPWSLVKTDNFTVYSGAGRQAGVDIARDMEMLHSVLENLAGRATKSPLPTYVYVFPSDDALQPFKPASADGRRGSGRAVASGYFSQRELANYVAINLKTSRGSRETIQHEYLHYFTKYNLPRLPFWFNEGIAEYYSTFSVTNGIGEVGAPVYRHLQRLARSGDFQLSRRDLDRLEVLRSSKELYDDQHSASLAYAQSWALVHYLLSDDQLASQTLNFMRALAAGEQPDSAFRSSFGGGLADLSADIRRYFSRSDFPTFRADVDRVSTPTLFSLAAAERDVALGELALEIGNRNLARRLFQSARDRSQRLDPERARAIEGFAQIGFARLAIQARDTDQAILIASDAVELLPGSPLALLIKGKAHLESAENRLGSRSDEEFVSKEFDASRRAIQRALQIEPDFTAALVASGRTLLRDPRTAEAGNEFSKDGIRDLRRAIELLPWRHDVVSQLALLYTLSGDLPKAVTLLLREGARFPSEEAKTSVWESVASIETNILHRALSRPNRPPLPQDELRSYLQRVNVLVDMTNRFSQLGTYFDQALELQRLARIEGYWARLLEIRDLVGANLIEEARFDLRQLSVDLQFESELEGPRLDRLEQEITQLSGSLGDLD